MTIIGSRILKAFLQHESRRAGLSDPPTGPFDKVCPDLIWTRRGSRRGHYESAFIPTARYHDFLVGEQKRTGTTFYVKKNIKNNADSFKAASNEAESCKV